ncbi:MAG: class I SAM-dependent methyltransferase [Nakamurella sp.]
MTDQQDIHGNDGLHGDDHHHTHGTVTPAQWDDRYREPGLVWGGAPNRFVAEYLADVPAGRAVDLACGQGRNAIYLAERGWTVTGVDFSEVAVDRARELAPNVTWVCADIATFEPDPVDLAILIYSHLPTAQRRNVLRHAAAALRPGGRLFVVGHNTRNIAEGAGGPQNPDILYTPTDLIDDLGKVAPDLLVEVAAEPLRDVLGADRPAIDTVVLARHP